MATKARMGRNAITSLTVQVKAWATPTAGDCKQSGNSPEAFAKGHQGALTDQAVRLWPTPRASEGFRGTDPPRPGREGGDSLMQATRSWPAPTAHDHKDLGGPPSQHDRKSPGLATVASVHGPPDGTTSTDGGTTSPKADLNPRFVEALMGVPPNWLTPSTSVETDSFRRWLHAHSLSSPTGSASTSGKA